MQATKPVTKPTKQRKMLFQAPDHIRYKHFAAPLSAELKASHGINALPVRSGDTVKIMRGDHKGFEGKITSVDRQKYRVFVEGLTSEKVDGTAVFVPIHPSKVVITNLNLEDKWRKTILDRKKAQRKKEEIVEKKPAKAVPEVKEEAVEVVEEKPAIEEKPKEKKPRARRKRVVKVAKAGKAEKQAAEAETEKAPTVKKPRAKRKTRKKAAKSEGGA
ncbi:MAG TPA: 50S ribosomal protein L24 [Candidatus Acidoferrum sp.]|jgi:large subunit ribosomal protein L24|nr:50S ribosomal protein L24 [Candidatus Acidoferrum sp.]